MTTIMSLYPVAGFGLDSMGIGEWAILFAIVLIFFGPKRLPDLSRAIGKSIRDFKKGLTDIKEDINTSDENEPAKPEAAKSNGATAKSEAHESAEASSHLGGKQ